MSSARFPAFGLLFLGLVALGGTALGQVTTSSLTVGGIGAFGCESPQTDPPTLENGQVATGTCDFSYDGPTQILTLTVANTSPVLPGQDNPVIRRVYVNLPHLACTGATLLSQTAAGGTAPDFNLSVDTNITNTSGTIIGGCFGRFGIRLRDSGGIAGSIANPLAVGLPGPTGAMAIGPVIFQIQILGASEAVTSLVASAFSSSLSFNPGGEYVNAVFKFEPGDDDLDDEENFISSSPVGGGGSPAGWIVGNLQVGSEVTVVMAGTPQWEMCMVAATTPGPITVGGYTFPIGEDWFPVLTGQIPASGFSSLTLTIPGAPPGPELGGLTVYGLVIAASPDLRTISASEQFAIFIEF